MQRLFRNASVVMAGFVVANLLGLLRQVIINRAFGTSAELDAYFAAFRVPDLLFNILAGGALGSAFIPLFAELIEKNDRPHAWRLASAITNNLLIALSLIATVAATAAPLLVKFILAPGFDSATQAITVDLMRIMFLSMIIFGMSGLLMGIHNAHHHFLSTALAPIFYNVGIIVGALSASQLGVYGLAWGVVLGAALHLVVQLPALIRHQPRYTFALDLKDSAVQQVGKLMLPRMFGLAVWQINFWVNVSIASTLPVGSLSAITIAFQIFTFPQAAIAQAIATAVFPTLASHAAKESRDELNETLTTALRLTLFLALPAMIGLILLGQPLIALLFQSGKFTEQSTSLVSWALTWYGVGLISHSIVEVITRAFYAMKDTRTPVVIGAAAMILNVILSLTLTRLFAAWNFMPHGGLALANTLATTIEAIALWMMLGKHNARVIFGSLFNSVWRSGIATLAMSLAVIGWGQVMSAPLWLLSLGGAIVGAAVYFVIALIVRSPEIKLPKFSRFV